MISDHRRLRIKELPGRCEWVWKGEWCWDGPWVGLLGDDLMEEVCEFFLKLSEKNKFFFQKN